jgi:hypothetical protein
VDDHVIEREFRFAIALLVGRSSARDENLVTKTEYLSRHTKPSEREARSALINLLFRMCEEISDERFLAILGGLASVFSEDTSVFEESSLHPLKVVLRRRGKGHSDHRRDYSIARIVQILRNQGVKGATAKVAEVLGRDERHIKRIYARHKDELDVSSDGRSGDMVSDR